MMLSTGYGRASIPFAIWSKIRTNGKVDAKPSCGCQIGLGDDDKAVSSGSIGAGKRCARGASSSVSPAQFSTFGNDPSVFDRLRDFFWRHGRGLFNHAPQHGPQFPFRPRRSRELGDPLNS